MEKIKQWLNQIVQSEKGKDILIVIIVILVGLVSFELGRLSKKNENFGIKIEYPDETKNQEARVILSQNFLGVNTKNSPIISDSTGKFFFASNKGSKYYSIGCSAGKTIKLGNRVYFTTGGEAQKAGYELSNSCK
ncbi:MAG: hypothetical protein AAB595_02835 [Patescibacteria group bacterium]